MITPNNFTRIKPDGNGNPRYVCHFLHILPEGGANYAHACKLANSIGGRKFHNRQYGGGIVFQSYSLDETCKSINKLNGSI